MRRWRTEACTGSTKSLWSFPSNASASSASSPAYRSGRKTVPPTSGDWRNFSCRRQSAHVRTENGVICTFCTPTQQRPNALCALYQVYLLLHTLTGRAIYTLFTHFFRTFYALFTVFLHSLRTLPSVSGVRTLRTLRTFAALFTFFFGLLTLCTFTWRAIYAPFTHFAHFTYFTLHTLTGCAIYAFFLRTFLHFFMYSLRTQFIRCVRFAHFTYLWRAFYALFPHFFTWRTLPSLRTFTPLRTLQRALSVHFLRTFYTLCAHFGTPLSAHFMHFAPFARTFHAHFTHFSRTFYALSALCAIHTLGAAGTRREATRNGQKVNGHASFSASSTSAPSPCPNQNGWWIHANLHDQRAHIMRFAHFTHHSLRALRTLRTLFRHILENHPKKDRTINWNYWGSPSQVWISY